MISWAQILWPVAVHETYLLEPAFNYIDRMSFASTNAIEPLWRLDIEVVFWLKGPNKTIFNDVTLVQSSANVTESCYTRGWCTNMRHTERNTLLRSSILLSEGTIHIREIQVIRTIKCLRAEYKVQNKKVDKAPVTRVSNKSVCGWRHLNLWQKQLQKGSSARYIWVP